MFGISINLSLLLLLFIHLGWWMLVDKEVRDGNGCIVSKVIKVSL